MSLMFLHGKTEVLSLCMCKCLWCSSMVQKKHLLDVGVTIFAVPPWYNRSTYSMNVYFCCTMNEHQRHLHIHRVSTSFVPWRNIKDSYTYIESLMFLHGTTEVLTLCMCNCLWCSSMVQKRYLLLCRCKCLCRYNCLWCSSMVQNRYFM